MHNHDHVPGVAGNIIVQVQCGTHMIVCLIDADGKSKVAAEHGHLA